MGTDDLNWTDRALRDPHGVADKAARVRALFARIAPRYDLANCLHTFGRDRAWRRATVVAARPGADSDVLDVACGTGDLAGAFDRAGAARVVGLDFTPEMLAEARRKFAASPIEWVRGDAMALPFRPGSFDVVSIAFGLRNVVDSGGALREFHRVLRPGGRLAVLEFAMPEGGIWGRLGRLFIRRVIPVTGRMLSGDRGGAYKYLAASVDTYMTFEQLRQAMTGAGFVDVRTVKRAALGAVGLHLGVRP